MLTITYNGIKHHILVFSLLKIFPLSGCVFFMQVSLGVVSERGLFVFLFDLPIQHASDLSTFTLKDERIL